MPLLKLTFFFSCLFVLTGCKSQKSLPKNLDEAILYFQQEWTKDELDEFKNKPEKDAVSELHFGTGLWIRNTWIRGDRDSALTNYFHAIGIDAPDDISSIILTSVHRVLNKKDVQLKEQVERYKLYWKAIFDCDEKQKARAVSNYNKFKIGDTVTIYMPVDTANGNNNAFVYCCPTPDWTFDKGKDLVLKGTIAKKYFISSTANVFFTVRVDYMNRNRLVLMEQFEIGKEKDFSLRGLTIE